MAAGLLLLQLSLAALDVEGTSTCPRPEEVREKIRQLAPRLLTSPGQLRATVSSDEAGVHLLLRGADGSTVAERRVSGSGNCDALASAAGVVLVAWAAELQSAPVSQEAPPDAPMPGRDLEGERTEPLPLERERAEWPVDVDVSAGLSASLGASSVAVGGLVTGAATARASHLGGQLTLAALGARTRASTTWERFALGGGPHYRFALGAVDLDVDAGLLAALLTVIPELEGPGQSALDAGARLGARVLSRGGLWGGVQALGWFARRLHPNGEPLPQFEVLLTGGLVWSHP